MKVKHEKKYYISQSKIFFKQKIQILYFIRIYNEFYNRWYANTANST